MKLNGFVGKGSGKLGASVFAISGGEQIVRQYNPQVANPNSDAQVAQRAKLKLMSQLAAVMSPVLAFKKQGLVSARNQFVSRNIGLCTYTDADGAKCEIMKLDITGGKLTLPEVTAGQEAEGWLCMLATAPSASIKRVLYAAFEVDADGKLVYLTSALATTPGANGKFPASLTGVTGSGYIFAYGIADNDASVTMKFEDYIADLSSAEAALAVVSHINASTNTLSVTKCVEYHGQ